MTYLPSRLCWQPPALQMRPAALPNHANLCAQMPYRNIIVSCSIVSCSSLCPAFGSKSAFQCPWCNQRTLCVVTQRKIAKKIAGAVTVKREMKKRKMKTPHRSYTQCVASRILAGSWSCCQIRAAQSKEKSKGNAAPKLKAPLKEKRKHTNARVPGAPRARPPARAPKGAPSVLGTCVRCRKKTRKRSYGVKS